MGGEIAQVIAAADVEVVLKDVKQEFVDAGIEKARSLTKASVDKLVSKEKITQEQADEQLEAVMGRIHGTLDYSDFGDVDFVVEAAPEKMEIKQQVFAELDSVTPGHAIIASNTSSLSITEMGLATLRPDKVCGFHFFYPASVMPLVEIVAGEDTSEETLQAASNFAQAIRKQPITCEEVPGFVVNRILNSAVGEVWREQEEKGLSIKKIDEAVAEAKTAPMGPFILGDMLGLDTIVHVAEHLNDSYGDSFYVHKGMKERVEEGKLGLKTGGEGLYKDGEPQVPGDADPPEDLADLFTSKALVESCLLIEEGVANVRDIDLGMMAGAGMDPRRGIFPPLMKADMDGLDVVLRAPREAGGGARRALRAAADPPPAGRAGPSGPEVGTGLLPLPAARRGRSDGHGEDRDSRRRRHRLAREPADERDLPAAHRGPRHGLGAPQRGGRRPRDGHLLDRPGGVLGRRRHQVVHPDRPEKGAEVSAGGHNLLRELGSGRIVTIAAVNALAFGGGCELAMACDFRIAAASAVFGQPEIKLGIIPGFGGTQRLPKLVGSAKALEMNLVGDAISSIDALEHGLAQRVVPDHELFDTALMWARRLAGQAPVAVEQIKQVSNKGDLDEGIEAEKEGFAKAFLSEDGKEGISAFLGKRTPKWQGR